MEAEVFNRGKYQIIYCVLLSVFALATMSLMLWYASRKVVIVAAEDAEITAEEIEIEKSESDRTFKLEFSSNSRDGWIHFTCPSSMVLGDITVSERPDLRKIIIDFSGENSDFFYRNAPYGDFIGVSEITESSVDGRIHIVLDTDRIYYADTKMADHEFMLKLNSYTTDKPRVVVDPYFGGSHSGTTVGSLMEKDINQAIANKVKELANDRDYYLILTKNSDYTLSTMERMDIIEAVQADYYIGISLITDMEDQSSFGMKAVYNDEYYRSGLENVDFADYILRKACQSACNKANDLEKAGEEFVVLKALDIPATQFFAGTITNSEESELLRTDSYITKIAEGIVAALDEVVIR